MANKYLELIRLPNVITAAADSWTGFFIVLAVSGRHTDGMPDAPSLAVLPFVILVSCLLYAAGVIFNDVSDFEHDKKHRPDRPLPSGRISRNGAFATAAVLVVIAMLLAMLAGYERLIVAFTLLGCIIAYNILSKAAPVAAVPLMGMCRGMNIILGMGFAPKVMPVLLIAPGLIIVYTMIISYISLSEEKSAAAGKLVKYCVLAIPAIDAVILICFGGYPASLFCLAICAGAIVLSRRLPTG